MQIMVMINPRKLLLVISQYVLYLKKSFKTLNSFELVLYTRINFTNFQLTSGAR